jgi:hypothetical protein
MKRLIAAALAAAALASQALAQPEPKTQLIDIDGARVPVLKLREGSSYATWVVDTRSVLYRDEFRQYFLVTLKSACAPLAVRDRRFDFHPSAPWRLKETSEYELRAAGSVKCEVATIARIDDARASPLRDASLWRAW